MTDEKQVVKETFIKYSDTFAQLDPNALVPFYHHPVILIDSQRIFAINLENPEDFEKAMLALLTPMMEGLKRLEYDRSETQNLSAKLLSQNTAIVSGVGIRFKKDGSEFGKFGFTYTFRKTDRGWKIIAGIIHDTNTALQLE